MIKLNLGCWRYKKKGYINIDINKDFSPDIVHDLNIFPYPFDDNSVDEIYMYHILEHLENPMEVIRECRRILKFGCKLIIIVPHFSRDAFYQHRGAKYSIQFYKILDRKNMSYDNVFLNCVSHRFRWYGIHPLKTNKMMIFIGYIINFFANNMQSLCDRVWCFYVGGFDEIYFEFEK